MRTLIIADIHNHTKWADKLLSEVKHDKVIFLGDYFDNFGDTPNDARETALWLKNQLKNPRNNFIIGNHDLPYKHNGSPLVDCPGYSYDKLNAIKPILNKHDWSKFKFFIVEQDYWLSHAGISSKLFNDNGTISPHIVINRLKEADNKLSHGISAPEICHQGYSIVWVRPPWLDIIPKVRQIFGHTPMDSPYIKSEFGGFNVCLDTFGKFYGLIEDGRFYIGETATHILIEIK